jgi:VWFA-related protein
MRCFVFGLLGAASLIAGTGWTQTPDYTLRVDVPFVAVNFSVEDLGGKPVPGLSADAFTVYEDGIPQKVVEFLPVPAPYNILLLFDRSGSTQDKWPLMQRAVAGFIAELRPQDRIAIAAFDYSLDMLLPWTNDRRRALGVLPRLIEGDQTGGTDFYAAIDQAMRREFKDAPGRGVLVVLTDGRDTSLFKTIVNTNRLPDRSQDRRYQRLLKTASSARIPAYFVAFNTDKNYQPNTIGGDEYRNLRLIFPNSPIADGYLEDVRMRMEQIAEASGGRTLYPERLDDIVPLYERIGK